jgi:hypothetical protein
MTEVPSIRDDFADGANPHWNRFAVGHAWVQEEKGLIRFVVGPVPENGTSFTSDAELSDYRLYERGTWPWRPPLRMTVRARSSDPTGALIGTMGFGFWNFTFTTTDQVASSPQAVWFFYASPQSYMTLQGNPDLGHGWRAQVLNGPPEDELMMKIANWTWTKLHCLRPLMYALAKHEMGEGEALIQASMVDWHTYRFDWLKDRVDFYVDDEPIYTVPTSPQGPLGFVAWLDNTMMNMSEGRFSFSHLASPKSQSIEMSEVSIEHLDAESLTSG